MNTFIKFKKNMMYEKLRKHYNSDIKYCSLTAHGDFDSMLSVYISLPISIIGNQIRVLPFFCFIQTDKTIVKFNRVRQS